MRLVEILRGGLEYPLELANGDKYDSLINIYEGFEGWDKISSLELIKTIPFVNTDPSVGKLNGVLAEGEYYFMTGLHRGKYKALLVFKDKSVDDALKVKTPNDLTDIQRTLPSKIINKVSNDMFLRGVNIHKGGLDYDYSEGCITIVTSELIHNYYSDFIDTFNDNEIGGVLVK